MFYVYILENPETQQRYIGYTSALNQRIAQHRAHAVHTTRIWNSVRLIYAEYYRNKLDAKGRERFLKSGTGWNYIAKQLRQYFDTNKKSTTW